MADDTPNEIASEADLRARYREPHQLVIDKSIPTLDATGAAFLGAATLFIFATTSDAGTDASPRGGPPGFVKVLDPAHVAFGDLSGNNRLDSYGNIVRHPQVGMIFLAPGVPETFRINGRASVTVDPGILDRTTVDGVRPKVAVVVAIDECFVHCSKALQRSGIWDPERHLTLDERAAIFRAHLPEEDPAGVISQIDAEYAEYLWVEGGI